MYRPIDPHRAPACGFALAAAETDGRELLFGVLHKPPSQHLVVGRQRREPEMVPGGVADCLVPTPERGPDSDVVAGIVALPHPPTQPPREHAAPTPAGFLPSVL